MGEGFEVRSELRYHEVSRGIMSQGHTVRVLRSGFIGLGTVENVVRIGSPCRVGFLVVCAAFS